MKLFKSKFVSSLLILSVVVFSSGIIYIQSVNAAALTAISDTMSREKASTFSSHRIKFTSTSAIGVANTIAVAFPAGFTTTGLVITDLQICHGATTGLEHGSGASCTSNDETIAAGNGAATQWGAVVSGSTTITFTAPSGSFTNSISAGHIVTIIIAATHMQNPTLSTPTITITTTSDTGSFVVAVVDEDQVTVTATVSETLTFDLDTYNTSTTSTETGGPYSVALGTLTTSAVTGTTEGGASTPNGIWFDLSTNAGGGAVVSVLSLNGANGLVSTSTVGDKIVSATGAMVAGTANYGICANRNAATTGTLAKVAPFDSTCGTTPSSNTVGGLTTSAQPIYNTAGAPISAGRGEIMVDAAISGVTPAHTDYTDTLTLIATATF
ncbi:MAG: hypothetical protein NT068_04140 [Candidatus Nomurabacteria bacterium]|nr:hypothetical protein [Candidatus Nomurabacteria bacterium]